MSINDLETMKYSDVGGGHFDEMMQQNFVKAHKIASEYGQKVELVAQISIFAPDPRVPNAANHSFSVQLKEPKYVSMKFTTRLVGGVPISDGKNLAEASQLNIFDEIKPEVINGTQNIGEPRLSNPTEQNT